MRYWLSLAASGIGIVVGLWVWVVMPPSSTAHGSAPFASAAVSLRPGDLEWIALAGILIAGVVAVLGVTLIAALRRRHFPKLP